MIPFPSTYLNNDREYKVPPSYEAIFYGTPALCIRCTYILTITLFKRGSKIGFTRSNKSCVSEGVAAVLISPLMLSCRQVFYCA